MIVEVEDVKLDWTWLLRWEPARSPNGTGEVVLRVKTEWRGETYGIEAFTDIHVMPPEMAACLDENSLLLINAETKAPIYFASDELHWIRVDTHEAFKSVMAENIAKARGDR